MMVNMEKFVALLGILSFIVLIPLSILNGTSGFIPELVIFAALTVLFAYFSDSLRLTIPTFTLVILGMLSHGLGVFGFYGQSPVPIQWDHITHFLSIFAFTLMIFSYLEQWMDTKLLTKRNITLIILVFFAASGVGALIELSEFLGYLKYGFGEGAFAFGPGDGFETFTKNNTDVIADLGGGWINTGWDLIFNTLGILLGIACMLTRRLFWKKAELAYYFENVGEWSKKVNW